MNYSLTKLRISSFPQTATAECLDLVTLGLVTLGLYPVPWHASGHSSEEVLLQQRERERERDECAEGTVALQADPIIARAWEIIEQSCPEAISISETASSATIDYSVCPSTIFYNLKRACDAVNGK